MRERDTAIAQHDRMVRDEKGLADALATQMAPADLW